MKLDNSEIKKIFESTGFTKHQVNKEDVFEKDGAYYRLTYLNDEMGYVIESADSIEEAKLNRYEDDDIIKLGDSKESTINAIKACLESYY